MPEKKINKKTNIGIVGLGTVGTGVAKILTENKDILSRHFDGEVCLKQIAVGDINKRRDIYIDKSIYTSDYKDILNDSSISVVVELMGGVSDAKDVVIGAINAGKHVVTANKALIFAHGREIFPLARDRGVFVGFEAAVAGGVPVIKTLREGLSANRIDSIYGIINGTANYILSEMTHRGLNFDDVLKTAQELGYAEADPSFDVDGIDAAQKLGILISCAYGADIKLEDIYIEGISNINQIDIKFARELGYAIKLLAIAKNDKGRIEARVHPTMVHSNHPLSSVEDVFNAVFFEGSAVGELMLYGKGAGMMPTASAVVADIVDVIRDMDSNSTGRFKNLNGYIGGSAAEIKNISELEMPYYLRFSVADEPLVLSKISGVLGRHNISISSVLQKGRSLEVDGGSVPLVVVTHSAKESELNLALGEIEKESVVVDKVVVIRIENTL